MVKATHVGVKRMRFKFHVAQGSIKTRILFAHWTKGTLLCHVTLKVSFQLCALVDEAHTPCLQCIEPF